MVPIENGRAPLGLFIIRSWFPLPERAAHRRHADHMASAVPLAQHVSAEELPVKVRAGRAALGSRRAVDAMRGEVGERGVHRSTTVLPGGLWGASRSKMVLFGR